MPLIVQKLQSTQIRRNILDKNNGGELEALLWYMQDEELKIFVEATIPILCSCDCATYAPPHLNVTRKPYNNAGLFHLLHYDFAIKDQIEKVVVDQIVLESIRSITRTNVNKCTSHAYCSIKD